ncbi:M48 family metallopeptidase [Novipirellula sp. SH528]|uniref:M48 family metallopeptidase n=1 Tax=Novipirellula sp. SH528 TaxID=3454466 RepID=UPI003FA0E1F0
MQSARPQDTLPAPSPVEPSLAQPSRKQQQSPQPNTSLDGFDWDDLQLPSSGATASVGTSVPAALDDDDLFSDLQLPAVAANPPRVASPLEPSAVKPFPVKAASVNAVPGRSAAAAIPKVDLSKEIQKQLGEPISMHRSSLGYRAGLGLLSLFMMAMPLAYVALVAATTWMVYHYTFNIFPEMVSGIGVRGGRAMVFVWLLMFSPIVAGVITVIFMLKPIFFSLVGFGPSRTRALTREGEPVLFELVDRICDTIKAPRPKRIEVNSEVNASASYGAGFRGIIKGELVLTIGVPLVAGLSSRQLAGILAHEFGHFSQGAGMRAQLIIGAINMWFAKVVYARDGIDEMLDEAIEDSESAFGLVLLLASGCVGLVRWVLWGFMVAAHTASTIFSRQMEFDADRYEIALVGSEVFVSTGQELHLLNAASGRSMQSVVSLIKKAVLIDNIPKMIQLCRTQMSPEEVELVKLSITVGKTGLLDTHPCTRERVEAAERLAQAGVFTIDRPARELFRHYDALCSNVTQDFYRNAIGRLVNPTELQPVDQHLHVVMRNAAHGSVSRS